MKCGQKQDIIYIRNFDGDYIIECALCYFREKPGIVLDANITATEPRYLLSL